jgi:orotidine-5'-phosphate decarboxylase
LIILAMQNPIIAALDVPTVEQALKLAQQLAPAVGAFKIGKELFTSAGPDIVRRVRDTGASVFLDLKFHDIPNTVAAACRVAASQGVWMLNVHASGGKKMLAAAREATDATSGRKPLLIGVTVLTSLSAAELPEIGLAADVEATVMRYASLVSDAGLDGVVCSAEEAPMLRARFGDKFKLVTPGIRLAADAKGDQTRVVTPQAAIDLGADYLVIGRSITHARDPIATLNQINDELQVMGAAR